MKKCLFPFLVACLSFMTIQAAAQENLTEPRGITCPASCLYGPRFQVIPVPDTPTVVFKFDKETGDTWVIDCTRKSTTSKKLWRPLGWKDEARSGEINYQLIVNSWDHIILFNVNTGTIWESWRESGWSGTFGDYKEVDTGI